MSEQESKARWEHHLTKGDNLKPISKYREKEAAAVVRFGDMIEAGVALRRWDQP